MGALGEVEFLNRQTLEYFGKTNEELKNWALIGAVHPDDLPHVIETRKKSIESGQIYDVEHRCRRADGEYRWFQVRGLPVRDAEGAITAWYLLLTDIDDRKKAEEALQSNERNLSLMINAIPTYIHVLRADGAVLYVNQAVLDYTGLTLEDVQKEDYRDRVFHPEDVEKLREERRKALTRALPFENEQRVRGQDGSYRWLTASIAHEINQPLSGIITNASTCLRMLNGDPPNVDGARETARRTIRDGNRASAVITRLRALFSKKEFTLEALDLNEAAREVIALSLSDLQRNRIILRPELAEDIPPVIGDRVQLEQVILNLLRNASDAMVGVDDRPRQLLIRTGREGNDRVRLSVQDTGTGIDPQDLEKLFEAFYTTKSGGMGIGLSVSRSIIERHHGRLWAEPNDGQGATLSFSIPCAPESVTGTAPP